VTTVATPDTDRADVGPGLCVEGFENDRAEDSLGRVRAVCGSGPIVTGACRATPSITRDEDVTGIDPALDVARLE